MTKIMSSIAVITLLLNYANADETTKSFYGSLKYSNGSGKETYDFSNGGEFTENFDMSEISLGLGYILSDNSRVEFNYNTMDSGGGNDLKSFGLGYILRLNNTSFDAGSMKVTPEIGGALRYYNNNVDGIDRTALGVKLDLGLSLDVTTALEVGIGYEFQYISWEDVESYYGTESTSDVINGFKLFTRYKF